MRPTPLPLRQSSLRASSRSPAHQRTSRTSSRNFSSSPQALTTLQRRRMFAWLNGPGEAFRNPLPGSTNYLNAYDRHGNLIRTLRRERDDENEVQGENRVSSKNLPKELREDLRPFPDNVHFRSEPVLSEELKQRIFDDVTHHNLTVREASEKHTVEMHRIGAVVRLKTMEQEWVKQGKPLATPYARAVLSMLPQTQPGHAHESINDLPVHRATTAQIFYPVAESRQFTRRDAGAVFAPDLLPADARIPHPQMVRALRNDADLPAERGARTAALRQEMRKRDAREEQRRTAPQRRAAANTTLVHAPRADFRIQDVAVTEASVKPYAHGIGVRYGVPAQDRKKGQVKIPRRVE